MFVILFSLTHSFSQGSLWAFRLSIKICVVSSSLTRNISPSSAVSHWRTKLAIMEIGFSSQGLHSALLLFFFFLRCRNWLLWRLCYNPGWP